MTQPPPDTPREPGGFRLVATLFAAGLVSGVAIVGAYEYTRPIIAANDACALRRAVFEVVPGAERMQPIALTDAGAHAPAEGEPADVYAAYDAEGGFLGYAIPAEGPGFQDTIRLIYGYDPATRTIVGMSVLDSRETPGLGDKIYKDPAFDANFDALAVDPPIVCVKHGEKANPNEVDAITGATISSKAVTRIVAGANAAWLDRLPPEPPPLASTSEAGGAP